MQSNTGPVFIAVTGDYFLFRVQVLHKCLSQPIFFRNRKFSLIHSSYCSVSVCVLKKTQTHTCLLREDLLQIYSHTTVLNSPHSPLFSFKINPSHPCYQVPFFIHVQSKILILCLQQTGCKIGLFSSKPTSITSLGNQVRWRGVVMLKIFQAA